MLPQTGTIDDSRIFAHLHRVQDLSGKGPVVNAIEIVGCCQEISNGLVAKINKLLPDAKVVTITQIADAQIKMNRMMSKLSFIFLVIIVFVGGAGIANYMYANVFERRREIGTLMALGANSSSSCASSCSRPWSWDWPAAWVVTFWGRCWRSLWDRSWRACRCCRCRRWPCGPC